VRPIISAHFNSGVLNRVGRRSGLDSTQRPCSLRLGLVEEAREKGDALDGPYGSGNPFRDNPLRHESTDGNDGARRRSCGDLRPIETEFTESKPPISPLSEIQGLTMECTDRCSQSLSGSNVRALVKTHWNSGLARGPYPVGGDKRGRHDHTPADEEIVQTSLHLPQVFVADLAGRRNNISNR
jgi:hypothetical protein